jgi:hypothetical protein
MFANNITRQLPINTNVKKITKLFKSTPSVNTYKQLSFHTNNSIRSMIPIISSVRCFHNTSITQSQTATSTEKTESKTTETQVNSNPVQNSSSGLLQFFTNQQPGKTGK